MQSIKDLKNIKDKKVIVRVDFNVPIKDGKVEDDFRIRKALPTIKYLLGLEAKVILISHLGKGGESLRPVFEALSLLIPAHFIEEVIGEKVEEQISKIQSGEVILLDNLRNYKSEQLGDKSFAENLASLGDFYVNEAFPVSHREDASIVLLPRLLPAYVGFQFEEEVKNLSKTFNETIHPFLFILGGAKISTKMPLIEKYLSLADNIYIGGALLNDILQSKGYEVGISLVDNDISVSQEVIENKKLILPTDLITKNKNEILSKKVNEVKTDEMIIDIGENSVKIIEPYIRDAKLILFNGPLGKYEDGGDKATRKILELIAHSEAESIIGGGDTVELISEMGLESSFSFVSTGGGATLDFLANGTLPGIEALK